MKKTIFISIILFTLTFIIYFAFKSNTYSQDPRGSAYAGSASCQKCHSNNYSSYLHTAHYMASLPAGDNTVHGSFVTNSNILAIGPSQNIVMQKLDGGMFQSYYLDGKLNERHRFDIALGGVKGESYLYWQGNVLYQLPVSYFTNQHKWMLSPGYAPGVADFSRIITSRCLECHASYIGDQPVEDQKLASAELFDKNTMVYSVDCERCHGPGAQHVQFHTDNPEIKTAKYITNINSLPRALKMDMCGLCHSGNKSQMLRSTFSYQPRDKLASFKLPDFSRAVDTGHLDVHGNQLQLLESSKCFIGSKMDCSTCHNVHQNQRGNITLFTQKCLNCHSAAKHNYCKLATAQNARIINSNCIKCHMPALLTKVILTSNINNTANANIFVRSHHIAIYPQETKKILLMLAN